MAYRIVMHSINAVRKNLIEAFPLHGERVSIQPQDMIWVNSSDGFLNALIESRKTDVLRIARLIQRVISSNPWIVLVSCCNLLPQPYCPVLMILEIPESSVAGRVIRMPVPVLSTRSGVHIQNGVYLFFCALSWGITHQHHAVVALEDSYQFYHPIQMFETRFLQYPWVHIILKMAIIERDPYAIQSQPSKELGVRLSEEILEPSVEKEFVLLWP